MKRILLSVILMTVAFGAFAEWEIIRKTDPMTDREHVSLCWHDENGSLFFRKRGYMEVFISFPHRVSPFVWYRIDSNSRSFAIGSPSTDERGVFFDDEQVELFLQAKKRLVFSCTDSYRRELVFAVDMTDFQAKYKEAFGVALDY